MIVEDEITHYFHAVPARLDIYSSYSEFFEYTSEIKKQALKPP
jgi:hypothetical protein